MAADEKQGGSGGRIDDSKRFRYIGFDVYPGKPKDLFKSDAEKAKLVDTIISKRKKGVQVRDDCTLMEERVSMMDRVILAVASLVIIASLFLPWYSAYNEIVQEQVVEEPTTEEAMAVVPDSLADSTGMIQADSLTAMAGEVEQMAEAAVPEAVAEENPNVTSIKTDAGEEVIHSFRAHKKINRDYSTLAGFGTFASIGSVGGKLFSSGIVLKISAILFLLLGLACVLFPIWTLYTLFGLKGAPDELALKVKKMLKFNWIPVLLFVFAFFLSFFGANYGFDITSVSLSSIGESYGPGIFLGTMTYGIFISLAMFVLMAVKGVEI